MKRPHMPMSVKLDAALLALGLDPAAVDFDHDPALAMRPIDPATGDTIPAANDPRHIVPRGRADHRAKTLGGHRPLSGDVSKIAKLKRVEREQEEFRARLLAKRPGQSRSVASKKGWRSRKRSISSRPFPGRLTK